MFPEIKSVDDLEPHIKDCEEIIKFEKDGYFGYDYVMVGKDTFNNPHRLECRGIKFKENGEILARPFHKFFNLGEKEDFEDIDWTSPHIIFDKLDGSMVHPAILNGSLVWMTRKGITDVSKLAFQSVSTYIRDVCYDLCKKNMTPIFEFTSPDNQIVIKYSYPALHLLAIRDNITGNYVHDFSKFVDESMLRCVVKHNRVTERPFNRNFLSTVKNFNKLEGVVICFENGHRLKVKSDMYVAKHHIKSKLESKKNWLRFSIDGDVDDLVGLMEKEEWTSLRDYQRKVKIFEREITTKIIRTIREEGFKNSSRKEQAQILKSKIPEEFLGVAFRMLDSKKGSNSCSLVRERILKFTNTRKNVNNFNERFLNYDNNQ